MLREICLMLLGAYAVLSVLLFVLYGADKAAARRGGWRTPEATLHLLAFMGGWPGALIAQRAFRHKTKKRSFRAMFWFTVAANCAAVIWLLAVAL